MKKIFILFIGLILCSCQNSFNDVSYIINNNSSKTIQYNFMDVTFKLSPDESKNHIINSDEGIIKPLNIDFSGHPESIKMNSVNNGRAGIEYNFIDVSPFNLKVVNTLPIEIIIKADNYIDNEGETEITINPFQTAEAKIFTNKPKFSSTTDYPVVIEWKFSGDSVNVIIR